MTEKVNAFRETATVTKVFVPWHRRGGRTGLIEGRAFGANGSGWEIRAWTDKQGARAVAFGAKVAVLAALSMATAPTASASRAGPVSEVEAADDASDSKSRKIVEIDLSGDAEVPQLRCWVLACLMIAVTGASSQAADTLW